MSKYATLPDIDDQPDVYETVDTTEQGHQYIHNNDDNQASTLHSSWLSSDDDTENLVRSRVSHKEASDRFKNSVVESSNTDFSDQLTRRKKAMYRTYVRRPPALETDEYEILPKQMVLEETLLQKFRRLTFEVQELGTSIENEKNAEEPNINQGLSQSELMSQITYLQNDLGRLYQRYTDDQQHLDTGDAGGGLVTATSTYGKRVDEAKSLIKQLEAYKALATESSPNKAEGDPVESKNENGDVVTYELFYTPEAVKAHQQGRVVDIDERIARIEKLVGTSSGEGFDSISANFPTTSLMHSLSKLEQQMTLLAQPRHLDTVSRRIKVLNSELDRLHELKSGGGRKDHGYSLGSGLLSSSSGMGAATAIGGGNTTDGTNKGDHNGGLSNDVEEKVNHLFATMEKVDPLLNLTPALLTRLKALQGLHTEAATFGKSVKVISEEQTRMTEEIKSLDTTCELLTKSLADNENLINKNVSVIDTRMTELVRRIEALSTPSS